MMMMMTGGKLIPYHLPVSLTCLPSLVRSTQTSDVNLEVTERPSQRYPNEVNISGYLLSSSNAFFLC